MTHSIATKQKHDLFRFLPSSMDESYQICERLGSGVCGSVCRVTKETNSYAAKIFHKTPWAFGQAGIEQRNLEKAGKAPHTLRFHQLNFFRDRIALVTHFVPGKTLLQHLNKCTMDHIRQTIQILEFLTYVHSIDHIYFDLKPENVIFNTNDNTMTVVDLGSMCLNSLFPGDLVGTNFYRSLSIWLKGPYDASIDMWAFGCLLFELFTKTPLFAISGEDFDPLTANKYVNLIVAQCGMPPVSLLDRLKDTASFFKKTGEGYALKNPLALKITPWKSRMHSGKDSPTSEIDSLIDLIDNCLRYEKPLTAQQALAHPFFRENLTHFSIGFSEPILSQYTLCLAEAACPFVRLMRLRLSESHKFDCLHVKTQIKGRFVVCLIREKEIIKGPCSIYIKTYDKLIIQKNPFGHWVFSTEAHHKRPLDTTPSIEESKRSTSS